MVNRDGLSRGQYLAELVIAYAKAFGKSLLADRAGLIDAPDLLLDSVTLKRITSGSDRTASTTANRVSSCMMSVIVNDATGGNSASRTLPDTTNIAPYQARLVHAHPFCDSQNQYARCIRRSKMSLELARSVTDEQMKAAALVVLPNDALGNLSSGEIDVLKMRSSLP